jgi:STE24 endopeptidase
MVSSFSRDRISPPAPEELFTGEEIERGRRYHRPLYAALAVDLALGLVVLGLLAFGSVGDVLYRVVDGLPWWLEVPIFTGLVMLTQTVARLPLAFWRGYVRERRWGLSTQGLGGWLSDRAKGFGVGVAFTAGALLGLVGLARLLPDTWPLAAALAGAALVLLLGFVAPVVLEPIFSRFERLRDEELQRVLRALADRAGAPVRDVLVADASRRTRKLNAYVSGFGHTRRVVVFDTLVGSADRDEVAAVVAHELGHRRERHVLKFTLIGMVGIAAGIFVLWVALGERVADPRQVPLILLVSFVLELATLPAFAAISRRWERVADRFALELTGDPAAVESSFRKLAAGNVSDLDPPRLLHRLTATHPTLPERIAAVRAFATVPP